jgi:uncharacterized membrane protein YhaH (DUF805 family)
MPRLLFWLWALVVVLIVTPIVFTVGMFVAREYGPVVAAITSVVTWIYVVVMAYIGFRAIGSMLGHQ